MSVTPPSSPKRTYRRGLSARHPGAKLLALLFLAVAIMGRPNLAVLVANALTVPALLMGASGSWRHLFRLLQRLRWVFLFVLLFHGWFSPGPRLVPELGLWSPSATGLTYAAELVAVVVLMAGVGAALVRSTPGTELAAGVAWLLRPLAWLGFSGERFGRQLAWTVDRVEPVLQESSHVRDALRLRVLSSNRVSERVRLEAETGRMVLRRAREAADRNAEALFLRGGGQIPKMRPLRPADWGLIGGAGLWVTVLAGGGWAVSGGLLG